MMSEQNESLKEGEIIVNPEAIRILDDLTSGFTLTFKDIKKSKKLSEEPLASYD